MTSVNIVMLVICALLIAIGDPKDENLLLVLADWLVRTLSFVMIHFIGSGIVVAATSRFIAQKYL